MRGLSRQQHLLEWFLVEVYNCLFYICTSKHFCISSVCGNQWFCSTLTFNFKINCWMLETFSAEPLFSPVCKTFSIAVAQFPCSASLPVFGSVTTTHSQENNSLEHLRVKKTWPVGAAAIMNRLNLYLLMLCWFLCHKPQRDTWESVERGPGHGTDTVWVPARRFSGCGSASQSEHWLDLLSLCCPRANE